MSKPYDFEADPPTPRQRAVRGTVQALVGMVVADLKLAAPDAWTLRGKEVRKVNGRDLVTGLPRTVVVTAEYTGPAATGGKGPTPPPPAKPAPVSVKVDEDGTFNAPLELTTGKWAITVTASSPPSKSWTTCLASRSRSTA